MIDLFITEDSYNRSDVGNLTVDSPVVNNLFVLSGKEQQGDIKYIKAQNFSETGALRIIADKAEAEYVLLVNTNHHVTFYKFSLERFFNTAEQTGADWLYSDYNEIKNGILSPKPVLEYQLGSVRDDFNFGSVILIKTKTLRKVLDQNKYDYRYAGLYDVRLRLTEGHSIFHVPEYLYQHEEADMRKSGEKLFDYVDPKNREVQVEMEKAFTGYLNRINAMITKTATVDISAGTFPVEASVIIPVKNRVNTIKDAVNSALKQKTSFDYNIIVIDNFSDDGTTEILKEYTAAEEKVIHIIPPDHNLGIGGCWNLGILHETCGRYAVQLDSDDLYKDENTLQKIVDKFYEEKSGMVIGSYLMTDLDLNELHPGLIDHKEWTDDNGMNNALRINGLGAPRAFFTPAIRDILFPNVSYGEDYFAALAVSRKYKIARIYEPLYLCRRWEGNSDTALDINKLNRNNFYKDKIRTAEIISRKKLNSYEKT